MTAVAEPAADRRTADAFSGLVALIGLITVLQGVLAGSFVRDDKERDARSAWIDAHAWGAHIGTVLAVALAGFALWKLRERRHLVAGSVALALSFLVEAYLGGLIRDEDKQTLTLVHVPLAMVIMGLLVWLAVQGSHLRRAK